MRAWRQWLSVLVGGAVLLVFAQNGMGWGAIVSSLLMAGVVWLAMARSTASGVGLVVMLTGLVFVTTWLANIPEGVLFDVIEPAEAPVLLLVTLVTAVAAIVAMTAVAGRLTAEAGPRPPSPDRPNGAVAWRLVALPVVFVVCYFLAGMLIYPYVEPYYVGRAMPGPGSIASMQVLRSLALVGAAYPLLRTFRERRDAILVLALALPVLGAIAPLLPANEAMPASIRLVHGLEMAPYYALFGWLIAVWLGPRRQSAASSASAASALSTQAPVPR
jgi:hypothetical protein